jgi:3-hydroxyisobutyrate dehydrogenase-like beta-hydroxyacid dehydrogenase
MKVGFIGLGNMGSGMAANLLKAGHEVTVYNRTPSKAQALVEQGAHHAAQVADACRGDAVSRCYPMTARWRASFLGIQV